MAAVNYMKKYFEELGADTVFLQEFKTPAWLCYKTSVSIINGKEEIILRADALGPSPSTNADGLLAEVVEVQGLDELKELGGHVYVDSEAKVIDTESTDRESSISSTAPTLSHVGSRMLSGVLASITTIRE